MQEIIVYRNPLEAAIWQGLKGGEFIPVFGGIGVFFAVFLLSNAVCDKLWGSWGEAAKWRTYGCLALGAAAGVVAVWKM